MSENNDNFSICKVRRDVENLMEELGVENYTLNIVPGSESGDNYLGVISKVTVTSRDKSGKTTTLNFVVKSAPGDKYYRSKVPVRNAYLREIYAYNKVFPEFRKLQEERSVSKPLECFAKLYKASVVDENEALIMEDMKELGYSLRPRSEPLDYNHVLLILRAYGKFHALSYALRDQKPELFHKIVNNTEENFFRIFNDSERTPALMKKNAKNALNAIDPVRHKKAYDQFGDFLERMPGTIEQVLRRGAAGKYAVIGHGDSWINNMLFKYEDSPKNSFPSKVCLIDWQLMRTGSPALDISYFIFVCTDRQLRNQYYQHFIQEYYDTLSSFLRELGSDPEQLFPFSVLQEHLKEFSMYGLYMAILALYLMTCDDDVMPNVRHISQEKLEKWTYEIRNTKFSERMKDVILDFVSYGYKL